MESIKKWLYNFFVFYTVEWGYSDPESIGCKVKFYRSGWFKVRRANHSHWYHKWQFKRAMKSLEKQMQKDKGIVSRMNPVHQPGHYQT